MYEIEVTYPMEIINYAELRYVFNLHIYGEDAKVFSRKCDILLVIHRSLKEDFKILSDLVV